MLKEGAKRVLRLLAEENDLSHIALFFHHFAHLSRRLAAGFGHALGDKLVAHASLQCFVFGGQLDNEKVKELGQLACVVCDRSSKHVGDNFFDHRLRVFARALFDLG